MNDFLKQYGKDSVNHRISKVLDNPDEHWSVRNVAIQHPSVTKEHINKVLNNPKERPEVRETARQIYSERFKE